MLIGTIGYRFIKNRAWARSSVFEARVQIRRLRRQMTRIGISGAQSRESLGVNPLSEMTSLTMEGRVVIKDRESS